MEEKWTILRVLQWTTDYFRRKGIEQPRANAEVLLAHVLGTERIQLYLRYDQPLTPDELARYREIVRRRSAREPAQYIIRKQEFWSLDFDVSPAVLIPRPETEILVEKALPLLESPSPMVLDLGTGSGAIAVALAHEVPGLRVVATDKSPEALQIARRNAIRHNVNDRILFLATDLFSGLRPAAGPFDMIVSNPPYIGDAEFSNLAPEVVQYEPHSALRGGGETGLSIIWRIIEEFSSYLKPGGSLLMEIGYGQAEIIEEKIKSDPQIHLYQFIRDYSGILRVLHIQTIDR